MAKEHLDPCPTCGFLSGHEPECPDKNEPLTSKKPLDAQMQVLAIAEGLGIPQPTSWLWLEPGQLRLICQAIAKQAARQPDETSAGYRCPQCGGTGRAFHRYHGSKTPDACDNCGRPISEHDRSNGFACPTQPSENGEGSLP